MRLSMNESELADYVKSQLKYLVRDGGVDIWSEYRDSFQKALGRTEECFIHIKDPAYGDGREVVFSHLHSDQYCQFLYFLANSIYTDDYKGENAAIMITQLNQTLNSCYISYKAKLPRIFLLGHPVGTVLLEASYRDYAIFGQNVRVGSTKPSPEESQISLGKFLYCSAGAKIIGSAKLGDEVTLGVSTVIKDEKIDQKTLVFTNGMGELETRSSHESYSRQFFYT